MSHLYEIRKIDVRIFEDYRNKGVISNYKLRLFQLITSGLGWKQIAEKAETEKWDEVRYKSCGVYKYDISGASIERHVLRALGAIAMHEMGQ